MFASAVARVGLGLALSVAAGRRLVNLARWENFWAVPTQLLCESIEDSTWIEYFDGRSQSVFLSLHTLVHLDSVRISIRQANNLAPPLKVLVGDGLWLDDGQSQSLLWCGRIHYVVFCLLLCF